jgi:hypothetical protein
MANTKLSQVPYPDAQCAITAEHYSNEAFHRIEGLAKDNASALNDLTYELERKINGLLGLDPDTCEDDDNIKNNPTSWVERVLESQQRTAKTISRCYITLNRI